MSTSRASSARSNPLLIVLSGPSGVGKDAVFGRLRDQGRLYHFTVTATTRPRRSSERDGVDYIFLTNQQFRQMIEDGGLLEWAEVYGNLYGVPKAQVAEAMEAGRDVIVKTDVQGAATIKRLAPEGVFIFLAPDDVEELSDRLAHRNTESSADLDLRLKTARSEMAEATKFDHVVINRRGRLDDTVREIEKVLEKEHRGPRRRVRL